MKRFKTICYAGFFTLLLALTVSLSEAQMNMQQKTYRHENDKKVEYRESKEFVICDDCDESSVLTKKEMPKLTVKFSVDEKNARETEKEVTKKVIHYQAPETVPFTVYFGYDKYKLKEDEQERLEELAIMLIDDGYDEFEAVGYTDNKGSKEYNLVLSGKRAESVKDILSSLGGHPSNTEGRGKCCTLSSDEDSRRVEIFFKKGGKTE